MPIEKRNIMDLGSIKIPLSRWQVVESGTILYEAREYKSTEPDMKVSTVDDNTVKVDSAYPLTVEENGIQTSGGVAWWTFHTKGENINNDNRGVYLSNKFPGKQQLRWKPSPI